MFDDRRWWRWCLDLYLFLVGFLIKEGGYVIYRSCYSVCRCT